MVPRGTVLVTLMCLAVIPYCAGCAELGSGAPQQAGPAANAAPPRKSDADRSRVLQLSGLLKDQGGKPPAGVVGVLFAIYEQQYGGVPVWQEVQNVNVDARGHFTAVLGLPSGGIPEDLLKDETKLWLAEQIMLPGEPEQPRLQLASAAQELRLEDALSLANRQRSNEQTAQRKVQAPSDQTDSSDQSSLQDQSEPTDRPTGARRRVRRRPVE